MPRWRPCSSNGGGERGAGRNVESFGSLRGRASPIGPAVACIASGRIVRVRCKQKLTSRRGRASRRSDAASESPTFVRRNPTCRSPKGPDLRLFIIGRTKGRSNAVVILAEDRPTSVGRRSLHSDRMQPPQLQPQHPVAGGRESRVVGRDDGREVVLRVGLAQELMQRLRRVLVEVAGRLVGEQQRRPHDQCPRHGDTLLLSARQHARPVAQPLTQPHASQEVGGTLLRLLTRTPSQCASASRRSRRR